MIQNNIFNNIGDTQDFENNSPVIGLSTITGYIDSITGETGTRYFEKLFSYTIDGLNWVDWKTLTNGNLTSIVLKSNHIFRIKYRYTRTGTDNTGQLILNNIQLTGTYIQQGIPDIYDSTVFSKFFEYFNVDSINWANNVLQKLYKKGIVANYVDRSDNTNWTDEDYIDWFYVICYAIALQVTYDRKFEDILFDKRLLSDYLESRGLFVKNERSLDELTLLANNFYDEIRQRGTLQIISPNSKNNRTTDGELLRLINKQEQDEFIFGLVDKDRAAWCVDYSSPEYSGTCEITNIIKGYEYTKGVTRLDSYPTINPNYLSVANSSVDSTKSGVISIEQIPTSEVAGIGVKIGSLYYNNPNFYCSSYNGTDIVVSGVSFLGEMMNDNLLFKKSLFLNDILYFKIAQSSLVGFGICSDSGLRRYLAKTIDGGLTWTKQGWSVVGEGGIPTTIGINTIYIASDLLIYMSINYCLGGPTAKVLVSTDGGLNFTDSGVILPSSPTLCQILAISSTPEGVWICGVSGTPGYNTVYRYNGVSWQFRTVDGTVTRFLKCVTFNYDIALLIGNNGKSYFTTDGSTWTSALIGGLSVNDMIFINSSQGWVVGDSGFISYTSNFGTSWTVQTSGTTENLKSIVNTGSDGIYVFGDNGIVLKTLDNGTTWTIIQGNTRTEVLDKSIIIDPSLNYEVTFKISRKTIDNGINFGIIPMDYYGNIFKTLNIQNGVEDINFFINKIIAPNTDEFYFVRGIIYGVNNDLINNSLPDEDLLNINEGNNLQFKSIHRRFVPILTVDNIGGVLPTTVIEVYDFKIHPLNTDFSRCFVQYSNIILSWIKNQNNEINDQNIEDNINKYLLPYNVKLLNTFMQ